MREDDSPAQSGSRDTEATHSPAATYHARCAQFERQRARYHRQSNINANVNVVLVGAALLFLSLGIWLGGLAFYILAGIFGIGFVAAYINLGRINQLEERYQALWTINDEGLHRLRRDWARLPLRQPPLTDLNHPYAADLDLLGHASLQHLLGTPNTPIGQATLQNWLLHPASPAIAAQRQTAAAELAPLIEFRDTFALSGRLMGQAQPTYERFLEWAEGKSWLAQHSWLMWLSRLFPILTIGLLGLQLAGLIRYPLWVPFLFANLTLLALYLRPVNEAINGAVERQRVFRAYADLFRQITSHSWVSPALQQLQANLAADGLCADQQMLRLARMMPLSDIRRAYFFFLVEWLALWDFHLLWLLERWQRTAGKHARAWLNALGEFEALLALAALSHDHPDWAFPSIGREIPNPLSAHNLGHPLLPPQVCVGSDVSVGPPGTFLLVTGSNMSGKSTLLRAIGVNVALAQAGGPVCAAQMEMQPITLATSIRVQDSLEQGVSYFMAELKRLKQVVDRAGQTTAAGDSTLLFLLDEILHGTNTRERQVAVRHILRHLLKQHATGAISTHDLSLADAPEISVFSQPVYFTERFTRGPEGLVMQFDYKLRPGIATSTNALKLLEIVGLPMDDLNT
jgi:energy-coupling factor transporter ATP-binding protein EcfA2